MYNVVNHIVVSFTVTHSLRFIVTGLFGNQTRPEFVCVAAVDEVEVIYYDSEIRCVKPRQDWMKELMEADPQHRGWYFNECLTSSSLFNSVKHFMRSFNQTEGKVDLFLY